MFKEWGPYEVTLAVRQKIISWNIWGDVRVPSHTPQLNRAALTLFACTPLLRWHFPFWFISRGALVPAWKLEMKPQSNSTNDCQSADWVALKKQEQNLLAFRSTSFPSRRCGCLCWACGSAEQDVMLRQILFWGSGTPQPTFMHTNASILEKTGEGSPRHSPSVKKKNMFYCLPQQLHQKIFATFFIYFLTLACHWTDWSLHFKIILSGKTCRLPQI